jgi:site-specific recombinase XerD
VKPSQGFPALLESFFVDHLLRQRRASPHTVQSYRDAFRLLLAFTKQHLKKAPSALALDDLDTPAIGAFLDHVEKERGNSPRTRNARLAAIHSFFQYAALQAPEHSAVIHRVLAMQGKKYDRSLVHFLSRIEIDALLEAPDRATWSGRRDRAMILVAVQTGLRVSELAGLRVQDLVLGTGAHVHCLGKGRKERCTPLRKEAVAVLRAWLRERAATPTEPLFPNARGGFLSRDGVEYLLAKHVQAAQRYCPSLRGKRVSPHVLRHSTAMDLLQAGVDSSVIALWLGHESVETTQIYFAASLQLKERALAKTTPTGTRPTRFRPDDKLLAFLQSL